MYVQHYLAVFILLRPILVSEAFMAGDVEVSNLKDVLNVRIHSAFESRFLTPHSSTSITRTH